MAKLLLSCDDVIYYYSGQYYAVSPEKMQFYQRYLRVYDDIRIISRCKYVDVIKKGEVPLNSDSRIEYIALPDFHGPLQYARVYFNVRKIIKGSISDCDAAILRIPSTVALKVGEYVKKRGIPYALEVVFDAKDCYRSSHGFTRLLWRIIDNQMRKLCKQADGISCVTESHLQRHYFPTKKDSFVSHYSSIALPLSFWGQKRAYPIKSTFTISHVANQVAFNGRKGYNQIIEALSLLKKKAISVKVIFAGKDYQGGVQKLTEYAKLLDVSEMVEFVGYLNRKELEKFLEDSDLFVMPTQAEGLPRVIIEAMAKGLPCITTPVSGNSELVDNYFLVPYYDTHLLAERIEELCSNPKLYEETSSANYELSRKYEASLLQERRDQFYRKLKARIDKLNDNR